MDSVPTAPLTAAPPAPHQVEVFNAAKLESLIMTIVGLVVTAGGAVMDAVQSSQLVNPHAHWLIIAGAIITAAARLQKAMGTHSFLMATDPPG